MPLKTAHSSVFTNVSLSLLFSQTHHLILSRLYLAIGGLSMTPYTPWLPPPPGPSCYLAVLLQSVTIYNLPFARLPVSFASFLHFCLLFASSSRNLGKKKKESIPVTAFHWIQSVCPERICFCCFFFLASFPSSFCTCSCTCITPIQKTTGSPLHSILSFLLSFCFVSPLYALQSRTFCVCYVDSFPLDPMDFVSVLLSEFCPVNLDSCQLWCLWYIVLSV